MLKLYICPKCNSFRYVSKDNITCYKCNEEMVESLVSYNDFIAMSIEERKRCLKNTKKNEI